MLTNKFKFLLGVIVVIIIAGGLGYNQYKQQQQINHLQQPVIVKETVVTLPTPTQVATPTASLLPIRKVIVTPKVVVVTVTPTVVKK